jgi:Tfp pilus assembly protein PilO
MEQLLENINKTAKSSSQEMVSVRPQPVKTADKYKELTIEVKLRGQYADFLNYISGIVVPEEGIYLDRVFLMADDTIYPELNIDLVLVVFSR